MRLLHVGTGLGIIAIGAWSDRSAVTLLGEATVALGVALALQGSMGESDRARPSRRRAKKDVQHRRSTPANGVPAEAEVAEAAPGDARLPGPRRP